MKHINFRTVVIGSLLFIVVMLFAIYSNIINPVATPVAYQIVEATPRAGVYIIEHNIDDVQLNIVPHEPTHGEKSCEYDRPLGNSFLSPDGEERIVFDRVKMEAHILSDDGTLTQVLLSEDLSMVNVYVRPTDPGLVYQRLALQHINLEGRSLFVNSEQYDFGYAPIHFTDIYDWTNEGIVVYSNRFGLGIYSPEGEFLYSCTN